MTNPVQFSSSQPVCFLKEKVKRLFERARFLSGYWNEFRLLLEWTQQRKKKKKEKKTVEEF